MAHSTGLCVGIMVISMDIGAGFAKVCRSRSRETQRSKSFAFIARRPFLYHCHCHCLNHFSFHISFPIKYKKMVHLRKGEAVASSSAAASSSKKYPIAAESYQLYEEIGQGGSACVYRALCIPLNEIVAIKILDFEHGDANNITHEAITMTLVEHPNVLKAHCSFACDQTIWVVTQYMDGGSCHHILKAAFPQGFHELVIATVLRQALNGLDYLHQTGHIHRDIKAGNILVDSHAGIKLGDFGVSACLFDSPDRLHTRNTFVGTPCWMAPEVMAQSDYDFKADIWSFGITALELAHGHAPFSKYPPHKVLLMTLQNAPPGLDYERDKKFSKSFRQMIAMCLVKDPSKRPSAQKLLKHSFFKNAKLSEPIIRSLLEGLPTLGERLEALKTKEAILLAQKKISDGKKEEMSQNEYQRGISSWNFNVDDLKAEASLIHDVAELVPENGQEGTSISLFGPETDKIPSQCQPSTTRHYLKENNGNSDKGAVHLVHCPAIEHFSDEERYDVPNMVGCHGKMYSEETAEDPTNLPVANGGDLDIKMDKHVFQQRGRFTVTSDDFDIEKAYQSPLL